MNNSMVNILKTWMFCNTEKYITNVLKVNYKHTEKCITNSLKNILQIYWKVYYKYIEQYINKYTDQYTTNIYWKIYYKYSEKIIIFFIAPSKRYIYIEEKDISICFRKALYHSYCKSEIPPFLRFITLIKVLLYVPVSVQKIFSCYKKTFFLEVNRKIENRKCILMHFLVQNTGGSILRWAKKQCSKSSENVEKPSFQAKKQALELPINLMKLM